MLTNPRTFAFVVFLAAVQHFQLPVFAAHAAIAYGPPTLAQAVTQDKTSETYAGPNRQNAARRLDVLDEKYGANAVKASQVKSSQVKSSGGRRG